MDDNVNNPKHYIGLKEALGVEVIDLIESMGWGYHLGNVCKYLFRHEYKGRPLEDLKKAQWYLARYIEAASLEQKDEMYQSFVQTSAERVPGSDGNSHRLYYNYQPMQVMTCCWECGAQITAEQTYITCKGNDYCSNACLEKGTK